MRPFQNALNEITAAETIESFKTVISSHDELLDLGVSPGSFEDKDKLIRDGDCQVGLSDVLAFATGCNAEPALGFDHQLTIEFLHDDPSVFPKSNTCSFTLYLPIAMSADYEIYRENLTFGILNGLPTFGSS
ncbi:hypothetical protein FQR65_LT18244 [Abscondita terminalis]|nr:hypothetical protein FQR65_LT18244 [Abscondita terminalis]